MRGNWLKKSYYGPTPVYGTEGLGCIWAIMAIFFSLFFIYFCFYFGSSRTEVVTVYRTERTTTGHVGHGHGNGNGNTYYSERLVVHTDKGIFECAHSAIYSTDIKDNEKIFKKLESGKKYVVRIVGWNSAAMNWRPNIVYANKLEK